MSRTGVPKLVPGPTMAEVAAEYDHRRAELKEAMAAERRAVVVRQHPPGRTPEAQADIAAARAPDGPPCGHAMFHPGCASCLRDHLSDASTEIPPASAASLDAALSNAALADTPAVREMGGPVRYTVPGMDEVCTHAVFVQGCRICAWRVPLDSNGWPAWGTPTDRPRDFPTDITKGLRDEFAQTVGALEQIHKTLWGDRDPFDVSLDDLVHGVATLKIERDEARTHGEQLRQQLEGARQPYPALDPANLPPGAVLLTGNEAAHYRRLQDAARASQAAQNAIATAGAELRDAFGALCKAISVEPPKEP